MADDLTVLYDYLFSHAGSYSIPSTRVRVGFDPPFNMAYSWPMSTAEVHARRDDIEKVLTLSHEFAHYFQYWSTTNTILEFIYRSLGADAILHIISDLPKLSLPFYDHFDELARAGHEVDPGFLDLMSQHRFYQRLTHWISGNLNGLSLAPEDLTTLSPASLFLADIEVGGGGPASHRPYPGLHISRPGTGHVYYGFGTHHLAETFATAIQLDHLRGCNFAIGTEILERLLEDSNALKYNLPMRLFLTAPRTDREFGKVEQAIRQGFCCHLRIFVDIAMMYSDFLNDDRYDALRDEDLPAAFALTRTQPGYTYWKVLRAFLESCEPADPTREDAIRLYNEICDRLSMPRAEVMLERFRELLVRYLGTGDPSAYTVPYMKTAIQLLGEKRDDPMLFVMGIANPETLLAMIDRNLDDIALFSPSNFFERAGAPSGLLESIHLFLEDCCTRRALRCAIREDGVVQERDLPKQCKGSGTGHAHCGRCVVGRYVDMLLSKIGGGV